MGTDFQVKASVTGLGSLKEFSGILEKIKRFANVEKELDKSNRYLKENAKLYNDENKALQQLKKVYENVYTSAAARKRESFESFMGKQKPVDTKFIKQYERVQREQGGMQEAYEKKQMIGRVGMSIAVPVAYGVVRKVISEYTTQEKILSSLAPRLGLVNKNLDAFRRSSLDIATEFGYAGSEGLKLVDVYSRLSDVMPDEKAVMKMARAYGIPVEKLGQQMAMMGRVGGFGQVNQQQMTEIFSTAMEKSGMSARSEEFMQSISTVVGSYAKRLPDVDPRTITAFMTALNQTGIPTVRGMGGVSVAQGFQSMIQNPSEAMMSMQTEIIARTPGYGKIGKKRGYDIQTGEGRYALAKELREGGLADADGLKLGKDTLKTFAGYQDRTRRLLMTSELTGLSQVMVRALDDAGFIRDFMEGKISAEGLTAASRVGVRGLQTREGIAMANELVTFNKNMNTIVKDFSLYAPIGMKAANILTGAIAATPQVLRTIIGGTIGTSVAGSLMGAGGVGARLGASADMRIGTTLMTGKMARAGGRVASVMGKTLPYVTLATTLASEGMGLDQSTGMERLLNKAVSSMYIAGALASIAGAPYIGIPIGLAGAALSFAPEMAKSYLSGTKRRADIGGDSYRDIFDFSKDTKGGLGLPKIVMSGDMGDNGGGGGGTNNTYNINVTVTDLAKKESAEMVSRAIVDALKKSQSEAEQGNNDSLQGVRNKGAGFAPGLAPIMPYAGM